MTSFTNRIFACSSLMIYYSAIFFLSEAVGEEDECPKGFHRLGDKCVFFANQATTWNSAVQICKDMESNLAEFTE